MTESETNKMLEDETKNILKIVLLAFISFDFFSPLTFKFFASLFHKDEDMTFAFVLFRAFYIYAPFLFLIVYLFYSGNGKLTLERINKHKYGRQGLILLGSIILTLVLVTLAVTTFYKSNSNGDKVIELLFYFVDGVVIISCATFLFVQRKIHLQFSSSLITIIIALSIFSFVLFTFFRHKINPERKEQFKGSIASIYYSTFKNQLSLLNVTKKRLDSLRTLQESVSQKNVMLQMKITAFTESYPKPLNLKEKIKHPIAQQIISLDSVLTKNDSINAELNASLVLLQKSERMNNDLHPNTTSEELVAIRGDSELAKTAVAYLLFSGEIKYSVLQKKCLESAMRLMHYVQATELIVLSGIFLLLVLVWILLKTCLDGEIIALKSAILIYLLMIVQMIKPVNPNNINIQDITWPFTYSNWYLPNYVQSVGSITTNDNSSYDYSYQTANIEKIEKLVTEMNLALYKMDVRIIDVQGTTNKIQETTDSMMNLRK